MLRTARGGVDAVARTIALAAPVHDPCAVPATPEQAARDDGVKGHRHKGRATLRVVPRRPARASMDFTQTGQNALHEPPSVHGPCAVSATPEQAPRNGSLFAPLLAASDNAENAAGRCAQGARNRPRYLIKRSANG